MAKGSIEIKSIVPKSTYFVVTVWIKYKSGYEIRSDSLRLYYSSTPEIVHGCPYLTVNTSESDPNVLNRSMVNGYKVLTCRVPGVNDTPLSMDTTYWLRSFMQLYKAGGGPYKKYRGPKNPIPAMTGLEGENQPLFYIANYTNPHPAIDPDTGLQTNETEYDTTWVNFTENIVAPTYDVNYENVNEDWEDADYVTHRIVPRTKVKGSLELLFSTKYQYNSFIRLLELNEKVNGKGYTELRLQVNNYLDDTVDIFDTTDLGIRRCTRVIGKFFITMENNPWNTPFFGSYDKYEPLRIELVEA